MNLNQATILIVEDEPQLLKFFGMWFEREGSRVLLARNGAQGLELAAQNHIDLVISDIRMPVMDGVQMAMRLNERCGFTPKMMFVSGFGDIEDRDIYDLGVIRKLQKPIRRQSLIEIAHQSLQDKAVRWSTPLKPEESHDQEIAVDGAQPRSPADIIAFGRGGVCLLTDTMVAPGAQVRLSLTDLLEIPVRITATVRWVKRAERLIGLEIRFVEPDGLEAVIRATELPAVTAFIPRAVAHR